MKENQNEKFVMVNHSLLSTTKLSSTQKLLLSYFVGWQNTGKTCFETNNTLATRFGMKYGGIRSAIRELNKFDFFKSISKDFDSETGTSGHEILVDIQKLNSFLSDEKTTNKLVRKYRDCEVVQLSDILKDLDFDKKHLSQFEEYFETDKVTFQDFAMYFTLLTYPEELFDSKGIIVSEEQKRKFSEMLI